MSHFSWQVRWWGLSLASGRKGCGKVEIRAFCGLSKGGGRAGFLDVATDRLFHSMGDAGLVGVLDTLRGAY